MGLVLSFCTPIQRGDVAFSNLWLPSFLILLIRQFRFLAQVGGNCFNLLMSNKQGVLKERISIAVLRVFNRQMACLHPAVSSPRGGSYLFCPSLPQFAAAGLTEVA